jgi:hypothetical protein
MCGVLVAEDLLALSINITNGKRLLIKGKGATVEAL